MNNTNEPCYGMQFVPCCSCGMFQLMNHDEYLLLNHHCLEDEGSVSLTCYTCQEKLSLLATINDLNKTISDLNMRIDTLTTIRDLETEIDQSVLLNLSCTQDNASFSLEVPTAEHILCEQADPNSLSPSNCVPQIEELNSAAAILTASTLVTNSADDKYDFDINDQNENNELIDFTIITNPNTAPLLPNNTDLEHINTSDIYNGIQLSQQYDNQNSPPESNQSSTANNNNAISNRDIMLHKFQTNTTVKTFFIGDSSIYNVKLHKDKDNTDCFKISNPNSTIDILSETTQFFLDKFHKNANTVVLHCTTSDMEFSKSEVIKTAYKKFASNLQDQNISLILSGPIPFPNMNSETFSRLCNINAWLHEFCSEANIKFLDNVDLFWKKPRCFSKNRKFLNNEGTQLLETKLTTVLKSN